MVKGKEFKRWQGVLMFKYETKSKGEGEHDFIEVSDGSSLYYVNFQLVSRIKLVEMKNDDIACVNKESCKRYCIYVWFLHSEDDIVFYINQREVDRIRSLLGVT
jgi:hypothetical protein